MLKSVSSDGDKSTGLGIISSQLQWDRLLMSEEKAYTSEGVVHGFYMYICIFEDVKGMI